MDRQSPIVSDVHRPAVILLGGDHIALSVARSLGRAGIRVFALDRPSSHVQYSRYSTWIEFPENGDIKDNWLGWLLSEESRHLRGSIIFPCWDEGLEFVARYRTQLEKEYIVIESNDQVSLAMLNKTSTYNLAAEAGIDVPRVWPASNRDEVVRVAATMSYPCALKPKQSYLFHQYFPMLKLIIASSADDLLNKYDRYAELGLSMFITELIPQADDGYWSYHSYLDEHREPIFHFTKRKLRQFPYLYGLGTYHVTEWNRDVARIGLEFFQKIGLRGIGSIEFMRDPRDGQLKLIECNARFTLTTEHIRLSGVDLPLLAYNRLLGLPLPPVNHFRQRVYFIRALSDVLAFIDLRRNRKITFWQWLRSLMHVQHFLYFKWYDPAPVISRIFPFVEKQFSRLAQPDADRTLPPRPVTSVPLSHSPQVNTKIEG